LPAAPARAMDSCKECETEEGGCMDEDGAPRPRRQREETCGVCARKAKDSARAAASTRTEGCANG
jgi:hypothetical protein